MTKSYLPGASGKCGKQRLSFQRTCPHWEYSPARYMHFNFVQQIRSGRPSAGPLVLGRYDIKFPVFPCRFSAAFCLVMIRRLVPLYFAKSLNSCIYMEPAEHVWLRMHSLPWRRCRPLPYMSLNSWGDKPVLLSQSQLYPSVDCRADKSRYTTDAQHPTFVPAHRTPEFFVTVSLLFT